MTLHYNTIHYITLHYITIQYITSHYITLHYITLHYIHTCIICFEAQSPEAEGLVNRGLMIRGGLSVFP